MSKTDITFNYLYNIAREFYQKKDFNKAFNFYKTALQINADFAVVWQEAGYTLMRMQRMAEAGVYFRNALIKYDQIENVNIPADKKFYLKACLYALLEEKEETIQNLKQALELNPELKQKIKEEADFNAFLDDEMFLELLLEENQQENQEKNQNEDENNIHNERGSKLKKSELTESEIQKRNILVEILTTENWITNELENDFENDKAIAPQTLLIYPYNPNFEIQLSYYIEEEFIFLDLLNKNERSETQICRLKPNNLGELIEKIVEAQNDLSDENWTDLLGKFIDICEEVLLQMPDGRQVKL